MKRETVNSSQIKSMGYDANTRTLEIEFKKGAIWQYKPVTQDGYNALRGAPSIGSYFHTHIKSNSTVEAEKISE